MTVTERLFTLQDTKYRDFSARLTPNISKDAVIGVRAPAIRALAKELYGTDEAARFMAELPHKYFDENNLHGALICRIRDYASAMAETERFLPYIDNWAVCDMLSPKVFAKHRGELYEKIKQWTASRETYTVRFGIGMLMEHFLDKDFINVDQHDDSLNALAQEFFKDDPELFLSKIHKWLRKAQEDFKKNQTLLGNDTVYIELIPVTYTH